MSEQTVARRYGGLLAAGALRVQVQPDERVTGRQRWFVRVQCRPDAAAAMADSMAARDDVSWVSITSGGSEIICVAFSDPSAEEGSVLARLPRTSQALSFTAFAVLHMHVGSSEAKWMPFDQPLTPGQVAVLHDGAGQATAAGAVPGPVIRSDDAPLIAALSRDGRAGVVALARATGWPQSRVSARLAELLASGALYAFVTTKVGTLPAVRQVEVVPVLHRLKQAGTRVRGGRLSLT